MSHANYLCRLCVNVCKDFKRLYDEKGQANEVYDIAANYFDLMYLSTEQTNQLASVMCLKCWRHIWDFHNFRESVFESQKRFSLKGSRTLQSSEDDEVTREPAKRPRIVTPTPPPPRTLPIKLEKQDEGFFAKPTVELVDVQQQIDNENARASSSTIRVRPTGMYAMENPTNNPNLMVEPEDLTDDYDCNQQPVVMNSWHNEQSDYAAPLAAGFTGEYFNYDEYDEDDDSDEMMSDMHSSIDIKFNPDEPTTSRNYFENYATFNKANVNPEDDEVFRKKKAQESDMFIQQWRPFLECGICNESLSTFSLYQEHYRFFHPSDQCFLTCCQRSLKRRYEIEEHIKLHNDPDAFRCDVCHRRHQTQRLLTTHLATKHAIYRKDTDSQGEQILESFSGPKPKSLTLPESDKLIAKWRPQLDCAICHELFANLMLLQQHFRQIHPMDLYYIECCQTKLRSRTNIEEHIILHNNPEAYKCPICGKLHKNPRLLGGHMARQHSNGASQDDELLLEANPLRRYEGNVTLKESDDFIAQWRTTLDCVVCQEPFSSYKLLQSHFHQIHPNDQLYIECCQTKLANRSEIEAHVCLHNDPEAFKCLVCGKCQNNPRLLSAHMTRKHPTACEEDQTDEFGAKKVRMPFRKAPKELDRLIAQWLPQLDCLLCPESRALFSQLQEHFHQKHRGEQCFIKCCNRKMHSRVKIYEHLLFHRNTSTKKATQKLDDIIGRWTSVLNCELCGELCSSYTQLRKHFRNIHPHQEFYIVCCKRKLKSRYKIEQHIRLHIDPQAFNCEFCGNGFKSRYFLKEHMRRFHPNSEGDATLFLDHINDSSDDDIMDATLMDTSVDSGAGVGGHNVSHAQDTATTTTTTSEADKDKQEIFGN